MSAFQEPHKHTDQTVMMHLLSEIELNQFFTQRDLARELNVALGLMNQYLKRCITKGWDRAFQASLGSIPCFLTPEGFKEKSHMAKDYLARPITFFRDAGRSVESTFADQATIFESRVQLLFTFMGRAMKMTRPTCAVEAV